MLKFLLLLIYLCSLLILTLPVDICQMDTKNIYPSNILNNQN